MNKNKKQKKMKKSSKKRKHSTSFDVDSPNKKTLKYSMSSSTNSSDSEEWVEKKVDVNNDQKIETHQSWMDESVFKTYETKKINKLEKNVPSMEIYDPKTSSRELNPYWKNSGSGLPASVEYNNETTVKSSICDNRNKFDFIEPMGRHKSSETISRAATASSVKSQTKQSMDLSESKILSERELNEIGAKIIKADILGNHELAKDLKEQLKKAREQRNDMKNRDFTGNKHTSHNKKNLGRSYHDGQKDIHERFEREKSSTSTDRDVQFVQTKKDIRKSDKEIDHRTSNMTDSFGNSQNPEKMEQVNNLSRISDCNMCLDSGCIDKNLIISMGVNVYLCLPWYEGLEAGHCLIIPTQHASCSTLLDDDVWAEVQEFLKALTRMFESQSQSVLFFETARNLKQEKHMIIHCVPSKHFELAPFFFKKAILESEKMWATNKQLITLKEKKLRNSVPKNLPYFWINFGVDFGFAHIIENERKFSSTFAQEIICGILNLESHRWRSLRKERNISSKIKQFSEMWKPFDVTSNPK